MVTGYQVDIQFSARELGSRLTDFPLIISPPELHRVSPIFRFMRHLVSSPQQTSSWEFSG
jgi:hypothetical protein